MKILVLNAGSSSQKCCLYDISSDTFPQEAPKPLWFAKVDWSHHQGTAEIEISTAKGAYLQEEISTDSRLEVIVYLLNTLHQGSTQVINQLSEIDIVGHRVVHGGREYRDSVLITEDVKNAIANLSNLAPEHNPANLEGIIAIAQQLGNIPQVAVFDTAFHSYIPHAAAIYPIPYEFVEQGIRRYGFHGISHQYCGNRAAQILNQDLASLRLINCHLGNGCSLAAIKNGRSIDTTMGFTPLDGLMMGNRSGAVDPGIIIYLMEKENYTPEQLNHLLNKESGLKGISGVSGDFRQICDAISQGCDRAQLALDIYIYRLKYYIGAMIASLEGLDVLIFTAGVGENVPDVRKLTCEGFSFLGLQLDNHKNENKPIDIDISSVNSTVRVLVIHTQEDWQIAYECWRQMTKNPRTKN
ncbi:acetate/propionate family kinase [Brunnivagina elsteri]|uniref:Acetate kinase n=1 Tax=Brunnivagina elsteri CCALA 953 TaxID=987040 RepID=A0A2A2TAF5_9CYAN|nr:acetate kinase [Calothrix elsteri]PAX45969.1 acetate kinase [Calothrix elsteri CCALA 953]